MHYMKLNPQTRTRLRRATQIVVVLVAIPLAMLPTVALPADARAAEEDEAAIERAHVERLRRAIEKHDAEQAETTRRRHNDSGRQTDITRLQAQLSQLERDESLLQGQMRNTETQLLYTRSDPADMSAHARRSELESRVSYYRSQLHRVIAEKQFTLRQLNDLRELRESRFR